MTQRLHRLTVALAAGVAVAVPTGCDDAASLRRKLGDVEPVGSWIYDDLELGIAKAAETKKPLLALFRCVL